MPDRSTHQPSRSRPDRHTGGRRPTECHSNAGGRPRAGSSCAPEPSIVTLTVVYLGQSLVGVLAFIAKALVIVIALAVLADLIKL